MGIKKGRFISIVTDSLFGYFSMINPAGISQSKPGQPGGSASSTAKSAEGGTMTTSGKVSLFFSIGRYP